VNVKGKKKGSRYELASVQYVPFPESASTVRKGRSFGEKGPVRVYTVCLIGPITSPFVRFIARSKAALSESFLVHGTSTPLSFPSFVAFCLLCFLYHNLSVFVRAMSRLTFFFLLSDVKLQAPQSFYPLRTPCYRPYVPRV
jgi:hypothetical protein